ncbi:MAG: hypothetical protein WA624_03910 [Methylocella sp.]
MAGEAADAVSTYGTEKHRAEYARVYDAEMAKYDMRKAAQLIIDGLARQK